MPESSRPGPFDETTDHDKSGREKQTTPSLTLIDHRYRVQETLGEGTYGKVFKCLDEALNVLVAVKVPNNLAFSAADARASFRREVRTLARLKHPGVMEVRDFREMADHTCYAVFEFVDGVSLQTHLTHGRPDRAQFLAWAADVADALHAVHRAELIHRDVKPSNILIRSDDRPCLVDFGLALAEDIQYHSAGEVAGTPFYMSPEQVRGSSHLLDGRADVWALGVVLYEGLTGRRPFGGPNRDALFEEILHREPKPLSIHDPSIPKELEKLVLSCLRKAVAERTPTADALASALRSFLHPGGGPRSQRSMGRARPGAVWASDGNLVDVATLRDVVFETPLIKSFLNSDTQFFISANKGLGKTLLLRYKRWLLTEEQKHAPTDESRPSVHFIPEGRPYLDFMTSELPALSQGHKSFVEHLRNCKRLWSFAVRASMISYFPDFSRQLPSFDSRSTHSQLLDKLSRPRLQPTTIVKDLLSLPLGSLNQALDKFENQLDYLFCQIHSGVYLFIDRIEQGLTSLTRDGWVHMQAGLIEAAWDVMNANAHVKVYATIREEAYANFESEIRGNYHSATATLRYTQDDLRRLINKLAVFYESTDFEEFVGLRMIYNNHTGLEEDSFRYVNRHTIGRPRDLVIICSELSKKREQLSEALLRDVVNDVSSHAVVPNVFGEMNAFLLCLRTRADRRRLFELLPCNILSNEDLKSVCCQFNGMPEVSMEDFLASKDAMHHPFCELYNCGLLGVVKAPPHRGAMVQHFKQPFDNLGAVGRCLPPSKYYLIHPSLQSLIHEQRASLGYNTFRYITVGHGYQWLESYASLVDVQRALFQLDRLDLQSEVYDVVNMMVESIDPSRSSENAARSSSKSARSQFEGVQEKLERFGYEELYLAMEELASQTL